MSVLFNQHWDVAPGRMKPYSEDFIMKTYNPTLSRIGLDLVGGYYVTVGMGPRIILVARTKTMLALETAMASPDFDAVTRQLLEYVTSYHSKILVPTTAIPVEHYEVQGGSCKFTQYWNVLPDRVDDYRQFMEKEFVPGMEHAGMPVTGGWRVAVGSGPTMLTEASTAQIVDIAKAIDTDTFRHIVRKLKTTYVYDYHSRILNPTGRVEISRFLSEMLGSF
ncbi:MAG: hypothetical protein V9G08_09175 [Dermatophilaceae bacterium]